MLSDMLIDNMGKLDQQSHYRNYELPRVCCKCYIKCQDFPYTEFFKLSIKSHQQLFKSISTWLLEKILPTFILLEAS